MQPLEGTTKQDTTFISQVARLVSEEIFTQTEVLSEWFVGNPSLVREYNRDTFNNLTEANLMMLRARYGNDDVDEWLQAMEKNSQLVEEANNGNELE